jgi:hypothetical protein
LLQAVNEIFFEHYQHLSLGKLAILHALAQALSG